MMVLLLPVGGCNGQIKSIHLVSDFFFWENPNQDRQKLPGSTGKNQLGLESPGVGT